jgi:hypothetical protein
MRRPARTGLLTLCDRDLGDFGFTLSRAPNLLGTLAMQHPMGALAGLAGQLALSQEAALDPTIVSLDVAFLGDSRAELMTALDDLTHWCSLGPVELSSSFDWTKLAIVAFTGASIFVPGKQFKEPTLSGTLNFTRRHPYVFDRYARRATTNGAGATNRVAIETGTAPSHAVLWLLDATTATITQRTANGTVVRQSTLTTTLTANDALLMDGARKRLTRLTAGAQSNAPRDLTLGHGFFTLEPQFGQRDAQRWQTLETSSGRLIIDYVRSWLR